MTNRERMRASVREFFGFEWQMVHFDSGFMLEVAEVEDSPAHITRRDSYRVQRVERFLSRECPDCGGQMKIIAALTSPASIRSYLEGVGLPGRPPPIAPARPSPQHELDPLLLASAAFSVRCF